MNTGEARIFLEHYAIVRDLDSLSEFPYTTFFIDTAENVPDKVQRVALKNIDTQILLSGNTGEAEYMGATGRTVEMVWNGKRWDYVKQLTPAEVDVNDLFSLQ